MGIGGRNTLSLALPFEYRKCGIGIIELILMMFYFKNCGKSKGREKKPFRRLPEAGIEEGRDGDCTHPHPNRQPAWNFVTIRHIFKKVLSRSGHLRSTC